MINVFVFFYLCCISNCFGSSHRVPPISGLPQLKSGAPQLIKSTSALCVFCLVLPFAFLFYFSCFFSSMMWRFIYWGWVFRPPKRPCQPRKGGSFIKPESALLQFIKVMIPRSSFIRPWCFVRWRPPLQPTLCLDTGLAKSLTAWFVAQRASRQQRWSGHGVATWCYM
jgi:hypothetical protein